MCHRTKLSGLHCLLSYTCLYECDHCFLSCSPRSRGTFTLDELDRALDQGIEAGINSVYFEGGEPFLFYPSLLEALRMAKAAGLSRGLVTNCYWAISERDAQKWLEPIAEIGIDDLSISNDVFHAEDPSTSPATVAKRVADKLGLPCMDICIETPTAAPAPRTSDDGAVIGGNVLFKGRAADKLTADLPRRPFESFDSCPHEDLEHPSRVHLDPFGNVFVCQGLSIGNIWQKPLVTLMEDYEPHKHPVVGPLLRGGPAELARLHGLPDGNTTYVDHCHLCYLTRKQLLERFPESLCPPQVYGIE